MPKPLMLLDVDRRSRMRLHEQIGLVSLPRRTRRNVTMRMGRAVVKDAKQNIRQQKTIYGHSMEDRKDTRTKRKLLHRMGKGLKPFMRGADSVDITWGNSLSAKIADRHQRGVPEQWTPTKALKIYGVPDYKKNATRDQAKALKAAGYRLRVKKKRGKGCTLRRVSIKWIMANLSRGQAGMILRLLREDTKRGKRSWNVKPAARPFLGPKPGTEDIFLNDLARTALSEIRNR